MLRFNDFESYYYNSEFIINVYHELMIGRNRTRNVLHSVISITTMNSNHLDTTLGATQPYRIFSYVNRNAGRFLAMAGAKKEVKEAL